MTKLKMSFDPFNLTEVAFILTDVGVNSFTAIECIAESCTISFEIPENNYTELEQTIKNEIADRKLIGKVIITKDGELGGRSFSRK